MHNNGNTIIQTFRMKEFNVAKLAAFVELTKHLFPSVKLIRISTYHVDTSCNRQVFRSALSPIFYDTYEYKTIPDLLLKL